MNYWKIHIDYALFPFQFDRCNGKSKLCEIFGMIRIELKFCGKNSRILAKTLRNLKNSLKSFCIASVMKKNQSFR